MTIRLCHPSDFKGFLQFEEDAGKFTGTASEFISEPLKILLQALKGIGVNATLEIAANVGVGASNVTTGVYDGCIGQVQANQSDMILQLFEYPVAVGNLSEGMIIYDTILSIASAYRRVTSTTTAQVMSSFASFSYAIWFFILLLAMITSLVLKVTGGIGVKKRLIKDYSIFYTLTHLVRIHQMPHAGVTRKLLFISASIFALVVVHCFLTLIKTELVVAKEPLLFDSYQDIMERGAMPVFIKGMGYDVLFQKQGIPKVRQLLWKYAVKSFDQHEMYIRLDPLAFLLAAVSVLDQTAVIVVDQIMIPIIPASGCPIAARDPNRMIQALNMLNGEEGATQFANLVPLEEEQRQSVFDFARRHGRTYDYLPDILFHYATDPNEKHFSQGMILNPRMSERMLSAIKFVVRRAIECGLATRIIELTKGFDILGDYDLLNALTGQQIKSRKKHVTDCMSETVLQAEAGFHALMASNFSRLFMITGGLFVSSFIALALECTAARLSTKQPNRSRVDPATRSNESASPARMARRQNKLPFPHRPTGRVELLGIYPY